MKVSLQLNNFATKNSQNLYARQNRNGSAATFQNFGQIPAADQFVSNDITFGGIFKDRKRGPIAQFFYGMTKDFKKEIDVSDNFVQKSYASKFTEKVSTLAREVAKRDGRDEITQSDRIIAVRKNLEYLLLNPELTNCYRNYKPKDSNGNPRPTTPLDLQNYVESFKRIYDGRFRSDNRVVHPSDRKCYEALVKVLKEDFKPMDDSRDRVLARWQKYAKSTLHEDLARTKYAFPVNNLRTAIKSFGSLDYYMRTELALYAKSVKTDESEQPELKSMYAHNDCDYIYYWADDGK